MEGITDAVFSSWNLDPWLLIPALVISLLYARGWRRQYKRAPHRFGFPQLLSFYAGLITVLLALISPLDTFAGWLLTVHMIQHLLLMMVAPPLILYGNPYLPHLAGMPRRFVKEGVAPFLASFKLRRVGRFVTHPVFCWAAFVFTTIAWHTPPMYQLALSSPTWHAVEHVCFLTTALLFWSPIVQPYPLVPQMPRWSIIPYLFFADFQNTALSAFLIFYERVLYPAYETVPRIAGMTVLEDQAAAGAIMWVASSIVFLIPVGLITIEVLSQKKTPLLRKRAVVGQSQLRRRERHAVEQRPGRRTAIDLLSLPLIGSVLRWPYFRRSVQAVMFLLAITVVADGLFGPQMGAMNLAGVLPWTHWRGVSVIALLVAGNVVCMACPFSFVRDLGRRLLPASWSWPRRLRSKWIAISLLFIFFWAYEAFSLWESPRSVAWLIVGYFAAALIIDGLFKGASFCKYVCPVGQYQFIQSLISPVEVGVRSPTVCNACTTHDCLRGNSQQRGCELQLFQPQKTGNMDCTFCLECVSACPHENVSLLATLPGTRLVRIEGRKRSLRWFRRFDGAVLIFLLVFAGFINAGSMSESVQHWEQALQQTLGRWSFHIILFVSFLIALVAVPVMLVAASVWLGKFFSRRPMSWRESVSTFAQAFVPLGFSMWLAHFSYHLVNGALTAVPVIQRAAKSAGLNILGKPDWSLSASMINFDWMPSMQLVVLGLGLLSTLYIGWQLASSFRLKFARTLGMAAPWAVLALVLYAAGVWIIFQPMQMRGMMMDGTTEWCVSK
jgi:cytochrome c oxidase assembly factor CtaG/ferredoxin